jgi:hypothetical protein
MKYLMNLKKNINLIHIYKSTIDLSQTKALDRASVTILILKNYDEQLTCDIPPTSNNSNGFKL